MVPKVGQKSRKKDKNCHASRWCQDLTQMPQDREPSQHNSALLWRSLTVKRMSPLDEGTDKASAGTLHSILVVSLGRAVSCFVISLSHGLFNCKKQKSTQTSRILEITLSKEKQGTGCCLGLESGFHMHSSARDKVLQRGFLGNCWNLFRQE